MHLRAAYKFALLFAVSAHVYVWTLSLTSFFWPSLFTLEAAASLHPMHALIPPIPMKAWNEQASNIAQASHWLLLWDYWIGSLAYLIFAVAAKSYASKKLGTKDVLSAISRGLLLGPLAAASTILWQRDEMIFGKAEEETKKSS